MSSGTHSKQDERITISRGVYDRLRDLVIMYAREDVERQMAERMRYKLLLGKFRVGRVQELGALLEFSIELPGLGKLICTGPKADVREGDLLTLYTEIMAGGHHE